jgi:hypothetical protein
MNKYSIGEVYKITIPGFSTSFAGFSVYVIIVSHILEDLKGFKSIFCQDRVESIGIDVLAHYDHSFVCLVNEDQYTDLLIKMNGEKEEQIQNWGRLLPEDHYTSDRMLLELQRSGVVTGGSSTFFE